MSKESVQFVEMAREAAGPTAKEIKRNIRTWKPRRDHPVEYHVTIKPPPSSEAATSFRMRFFELLVRLLHAWDDLRRVYEEMK